jgi:hypothetical protein
VQKNKFALSGERQDKASKVKQLTATKIEGRMSVEGVPMGIVIVGHAQLN